MTKFAFDFTELFFATQFMIKVEANGFRIESMTRAGAGLFEVMFSTDQELDQVLDFVHRVYDSTITLQDLVDVHKIFTMPV